MAFIDFLPVIGDVVNGVSSVISTSMANKQSLKNQREAQQWSEGMNEQQQQWQEKMWNLNNEYNSPAAQVDRLLSAGVNPNSAVGGMSQAAASSLPQQPSIPGVSAAPVFPYDTSSLRGLGDHLRQALLLNAEKDNLEADTKSKLANAGNQEAATELVKQQAQNLRLENEVKPDMLQATLSNLRAETKRVVSSMELTNEQKRQVQYTIDELLPLTKELSLKQIDEASQSIATMIATAAREYAQASAARAQAGLAGAQTEQVREQTKGLEVDNMYKGLLHKLDAIKSAADIKNMRLTNEEKEYFVKQLREFGFNVSENADITMLAKFAMLRAKGFMDEDTYRELTGNQQSGDLRKFGEGVIDKVLDGATQVFSAWLMGRAMGTGLGNSTKSRGVSPETRKYQMDNYKYNSNSNSSWNPQGNFDPYNQ